MGAMKVTVDSVRGVVTEEAGNGLFVETTTQFVVPFAIAGEIITATSATMTKPATLVATVDNCVLTLPNASTVDQQEFRIKKLSSSAHSLTINATNGQTIDGQTSLIITAQYTTMLLYSAGGNWYIL